MILEASQRSGGTNLALHLMKEENEHVEIHSVEGFMTDELLGAFREIEAISKGTRCKQPIFHVSFNPPETEFVSVEAFEKAIAAVEAKLGLTGQPRAIVFHEKEGRRHCHTVWSRIDAETMTAKNMSLFKAKLQDVSRELYFEHGWKMPRGFMKSAERDPNNFTLAQWQEAKRAGWNAGELKNAIQECYAVTNSHETFSKALEERGLFLARGDRRGHVVVTISGKVISIPRAVVGNSKGVTARLGSPEDLRSIAETCSYVADIVTPRIKSYLAEVKAEARKEIAPLEQKRQALQSRHTIERYRHESTLKARHEAETKVRAARIRKGVMGLWDWLTGAYSKTKTRNEAELAEGLKRDHAERQDLVQAQLKERQALQGDIKAARSLHALRLHALHKDAANYRLMAKGELPPKPSKEFGRRRYTPEDDQTSENENDFDYGR